MEGTFKAALVSIRTRTSLEAAHDRAASRRAIRQSAKTAVGYAMSIVVAVVLMTAALAAMLNIAMVASGAASLVLAFRLTVGCAEVVELAVAFVTALAE